MHIMGASQGADRLRAIGVRQKVLAERIGVTAQAVNDGLKADLPRYLALVDALEIMTPEQRQQWLAGIPEATDG